MPVLSNPRHERFAQELAKGKSASEAYKAAGYEESRSAASRLSANVNIVARVRELQAETAEKAGFTVEKLIRMAEETYLESIKNTQLSAAVSALKEIGILSGLRIERRENENTNKHYVLGGEPIEQVEDWLSEHRPH